MDVQRNPVSWFEIPVSDLEKARRFYQVVFGLELSVQQMGPSKMAWFPMKQGGAGAAGTLMSSPGYTPSHAGTLVYFEVDDIEAALAKIGANGGRTLMPKTSIGEYGFIAHFQDCEGNRVAVHSVR